MAGVLFENGNIAGLYGKKYNKTAMSATIDFDGGNLVSIARGTGTDVYVATVPATAKLNGLAIAYNPSKHLIKVGSLIISGEGITSDPRNYTNLATFPIDVFIPQKLDEIEILAENIDGAIAPTVGQFLEASNGKKTFVVSATQTTSVTSFKVVAIGNYPFPQAGIGMNNQVKYVCECVFN